ncbi:uncharacterized protein LOC129756647 isoform X2 [Uranotaenia lowii]|uniref:uncharacterized protein LOC129756647 isoform X2 n=1 Tax=Uranotaenia lowii TaxID=190385 RepID=UPI00247A9945|nr:uncharacterized protein LOC129756647 isoform X2 [Uranotaenia lowii]
MAPQNSTLIHGTNAGTTSAAVSAGATTDEELSSYSPILPARGTSYRRHPPPPPSVTGEYGTGGSRRFHQDTGKGAVKRETRKSYYRDSANDTEEDDEAVIRDYMGTGKQEQGAVGTDRPVDGDETKLEGGVPDEEVEIPIWIRGDPRFVAGINDATTCNHIIQALIEDELQNGKYSKDAAVSRDVNDYVITERWREVEQVLTGDTRILSIWNAWGDAKNEVQFRLKINKANGDHAKSSKETKSKKHKEKIGLINRMMRKVLKQGEAIQNHLTMMSQKSAEKRNQEKFRRYVKKNCGKTVIMENFLEDATTLYDISNPSDEGNQDNCHCKSKSRRNTFPSKLFSAKKTKEPKVLKTKFYESSDQLDALKNEDELLLVIEHTSDSDSGIFTNNQLGRKNTLPKKPSFGSMVEIDKFTKDHPAEEMALTDSTPKRKFRTKRRQVTARNRNMNRRKLSYEDDEGDDDDEDDEGTGDDLTPPVDDFENMNIELRKGTFNRTSFRFDLIRQEISTKMNEMQQLLEQEEDLLRRLKMKSAKFQAENQIYRSHMGLDFHVDRLQESIDTCAKEIIEIEQELLQTKAEIEEKSPLIENLRTLLEEQEARQYRGYYSSYTPSGSTADSLNEFSSTIGAMALPGGGSGTTVGSSKHSVASGRRNKARETEFVDNIHEFCDNNQSFVV